MLAHGVQEVVDLTFAISNQYANQKADSREHDAMMDSTQKIAVE
jgi:hypothetical protein